MSEPATETTEHRGPAAPKVKRRRRVKRAVSARPRVEPNAPAVGDGVFAGITATTCPDECTAERCVISAVGACKHPSKCGDAGCGPVTMRNRDKAKRIIKRQRADT